MSSPTTGTHADCVRQSLVILSTVVREMTPAGAKPIPMNPLRINLLARPVNNGCRVCGIPGHSSTNIQASSACRTALQSVIGFWEDTTVHISSLYQHSERFQKAIVANKPTYEMRLDGGGLKGGDLEDVLVERLTRGWLKFLAHFSRIRAKANAMLTDADLGRYDVVSRNLNGFLLDGLTCKLGTCAEYEDMKLMCFVVSDLFERSIAAKH
jgi:CCR4-NOT transcription complex subunit 2